MNIKRLSGMAVAVQFFPLVAHAEAQAGSAENSAWSSLFWGLFPIIILIPIFFVFIRKLQKPILKRTQQHMERQVQHMERMEQSLERIIEAIEKKD
jgi:hypothetical protein